MSHTANDVRVIKALFYKAIDNLLAQYTNDPQTTNAILVEKRDTDSNANSFLNNIVPDYNRAFNAYLDGFENNAIAYRAARRAGGKKNTNGAGIVKF